MLNWRRDPDHERKLALIERSIALIEWSIATSEQSIQDRERRLKLIESDTEQLREQNARGRQLLSQIDALCFPDASSSIPARPQSLPALPRSSWRPWI
jgi:septal ring factor EnvC (AmiA/AmiB activator)